VLVVTVPVAVVLFSSSIPALWLLGGGGGLEVSYRLRWNR